jgi:large subunit ribosomal protein L25
LPARYEECNENGSYSCRGATRYPRKNAAGAHGARAWSRPCFTGLQGRGIHFRRSQKHSEKILRSKTGHNTIFNLNVEGVETTPVMVVDGQYDPIRSNLLHVDLKRIDLTKRIRVSVPVVTHGEAKGMKLQGGLLEVVAREVEIDCLPDEIPEHFTVDVTELAIDSQRAGDIVLTGSMKLLSPRSGNRARGGR